jgi:hypothetical protein
VGLCLICGRYGRRFPGRARATALQADIGAKTNEYYAWYEMYPADSVNYTDTVRPDDWFDASVTRTGTTYTLTLTDRTRGWTETQVQTSTTATNSTAEAVIEDPLGYYPDLDHVTFDSVTINDHPLSHWAVTSLNSFDATGNKTSNGDISPGGTYTITYCSTSRSSRSVATAGHQAGPCPGRGRPLATGQDGSTRPPTALRVYATAAACCSPARPQPAAPYRRDVAGRPRHPREPSSVPWWRTAAACGSPTTGPTATTGTAPDPSTLRRRSHPTRSAATAAPSTPSTGSRAPA